MARALASQSSWTATYGVPAALSDSSVCPTDATSGWEKMACAMWRSSIGSEFPLRSLFLRYWTSNDAACWSM